MSLQGICDQPQVVGWVVMIQQIEVVYENGLLRPLHPVLLAESEHAFIEIISQGYLHLLNLDLVEIARKEVLTMENKPTIEEVRELLATIPGCMSESITAERGEY